MDYYVLDTNILVLAVRTSPIWAEIQRAYALTPANILISIVSKAEILSLAAQFGWGKEKITRLSAIIDKLNVVQINEPILQSYVSIDLYSQKKLPIAYPVGFTARNMGKNDLWIAAIASVFDAKLISTDGDFQHLDKIFFDFIGVFF
jgi:tRNA(fMet)-specific endonuclease VapC